MRPPAELARGHNPRQVPRGRTRLELRARTSLTVALRPTRKSDAEVGWRSHRPASRPGLYRTLVVYRAQAQILRPRGLVIWREGEGFVDTRSSRPAKRLRRELAIRDELRYRA